MYISVAFYYTFSYTFRDINLIGVISALSNLKARDLICAFGNVWIQLDS